MPVSPAAVLSACQQVDAAVRADQRYAHTSGFRVVVDGELAYAARYRGPAVAEVFSVTKTVLATVAGVAARLGRLPRWMMRWTRTCGRPAESNCLARHPPDRPGGSC